MKIEEQGKRLYCEYYCGESAKCPRITMRNKFKKAFWYLFSLILGIFKTLNQNMILWWQLYVVDMKLV